MAEASQMARPTLLYFADPMCSWCWGFAPAIRSVAARHKGAAELQVVAGGLFPDTQVPMPASFRSAVKEHWQHVAEATGQPFNHDFFDRQDFVYNTEPACRALVTARSLTPETSLDFLHALHAAFYRDNRDITDGEVLATIAAEQGMDAADFHAKWESEEIRERTRRDFSLTQEFNVSGFPSLIGYHASKATMLAHGCQPLDALKPRLDRWKKTLAAE